MPECPTLAAVPSFHHELVVKTSPNGITLLRDGRFKKRYTGNKFSCVDINGKLWVKASELSREQKRLKLLREGPKKTPLQKQRGKINALPKCPLGPQTYNNLSTNQADFSPEIPELSTPKPDRTYKINKVEVRQRILGYLNTQRGAKELYFWTVTFPAGTHDEIAYQAFNTWLTALRQYKMLKDYIWIAERQDGKRLQDESKAPTNTVHFHIAIPHKMPVKRANAMMAGTLANFARRGKIPASVWQCKRYNGVDISKNRNTKRVVNFANKKGSRSLTAYLTKYITKNEGSFSHLAWHNSRGYSSIFTGVTFTVPEFKAYGFHLLLDREKRFDTQFFIFIPWAKGPPEIITEHLYKLNSFLQSFLNQKIYHGNINH